tara:strand:- start:430 stop:1536 length:1107 start_codon:yes stop_codon:yes gene_type:complete
MNIHLIYNNNNHKSLFDLCKINQNLEKNSKKRFNIYGGNHHQDRKFMDIFNNGTIENYTNSCMWISILQYLNNVLNIDINIHELRDMGKMSRYENHSIFDADIPRHLEGLQNVANAFNLEIVCYNVDGDKTLYDRDNVVSLARVIKSVTNANNLNTVYLATYGNHFQLITKCDYHNIDIARYFPDYNYERDENKFLVFNDDSNGYVNVNELIVRNKLLEEEIKKLEDEIKTLKLLKDDKNISSSMRTDYQIRLGEVIGEKSEMSLEIVKNRSLISKIELKRKKYENKSLKDEDNQKQIKEFIKENGGEEKTKEFATNFLIEKKFELENDIKKYKSFQIPEEEKQLYLSQLNSTLEEVNEGLSNLGIFN